MIKPHLNPTGTDLDMDFYTVWVCPVYLALGLVCLKITVWNKLFPCAMGLKLFLFIFFLQEAEAKMGQELGSFHRHWKERKTVSTASLKVFYKWEDNSSRKVLRDCSQCMWINACSFGVCCTYQLCCCGTRVHRWKGRIAGQVCAHEHFAMDGVGKAQDSDQLETACFSRQTFMVGKVLQGRHFQQKHSNEKRTFLKLRVNLNALYAVTYFQVMYWAKGFGTETK